MMDRLYFWLHRSGFRLGAGLTIVLIRIFVMVWFLVLLHKTGATRSEMVLGFMLAVVIDELIKPDRRLP